jgi:hypothetical protein
MAGARKHMERSHRSNAHKDKSFRRFTMKAIHTKDQKAQRKSFVDSLKALLHRHQDK